MKFHSLSVPEFWKAAGIGVVTALLLTGVMLPALKLGIAPMPKMPSLAFAETMSGRQLPLPVGLLFHMAYVTFWSVAYVVLFRDRLTFLDALGLAIVLWLVLLLVFFPFVGWGFFGLAIGPKLIVVSLVPHLLFALFLWGLCRFVFVRQTATGRVRTSQGHSI